MFLRAKELEPPDFQAFMKPIVPALHLDKLEKPVLNLYVEVCYDLYYLENFESVTPPPAVCNSLEGAQYRDHLTNYAARLRDLPLARKAIVEGLKLTLSRIGSSNSPFSMQLKDHPDIKHLILQVADPLMQCPRFFESTKALIESQADEENPLAMVKSTALARLFETDIPVPVRNELWFEGAWAVAPPGTGKTQLLQFFFKERLKEVEANNASIVVIDSQGDLIKNLSRLKIFARELKDRLIVIKPDITHPPALRAERSKSGNEKAGNCYVSMKRENNWATIRTSGFDGNWSFIAKTA